MARDYAYEALAEVTSTDMSVGRGQLNAGLRDIRSQAGIEDSYLLADEIHERAKLYREVMPDTMLTPTSLAKHWTRVKEESAERHKPRGTNQHSTSECATCSGDRFVVVALRKPQTTQWMQEHNIVADESQMIEEMAPCPDCGAVVPGTMDPGRVREMLRR